MEWFVPLGHGVVMKETEEDTIPCVVSNPRLNVSLYERPNKTPITGLTYEPGRGFTGRLNDTSYVCVATAGDEVAESQVYYVFSIIGEDREHIGSLFLHLTCLSRLDLSQSYHPSLSSLQLCVYAFLSSYFASLSLSVKADGGGHDGVQQCVEAGGHSDSELHRQTL